MSCWGSLGSHRNPRVIAWSLPTWSMVWSRALSGFTVPAVSRSRSGRGRGSCRERTAARDYGFPVRLRNPVGALLHPVWFCGVVGMVWLLCSGGWSAVQAGRPSQVVLWGLWNLLVSLTM